MRTTIESGDLEGFLALLSADVVLRSPISARAEFRGHGEMRELMAGVFATIEGIRYYEEHVGEGARTLFYRGRVGSQEIEEACRIRFDEAGRIDELTLWIRPMSGLTALAAALGPRLARPRGRTRSALVAAAAKPLAWLTAAADRPLIKLVRGGGR
jgi:SnoaL-like domain